MRSVDIGLLTPATFFARFVRTRTPVLVRGLPPELAGRADLVEQLRAAAADVPVQVEERRCSEGRAFGRGCKVAMRFGELVDRIEGGETRLYLTTQELPLLSGGGEALLAPPLSALRETLPLRPRLAGSLCPQSLNLWYGRTDLREGTTSGLRLCQRERQSTLTMHTPPPVLHQSCS